MNNKYITIKGKKYLYLDDNDISELHATADLSHIGNNYGTTTTDVELNKEEQTIEEAEYVSHYINR